MRILVLLLTLLITACTSKNFNHNNQAVDLIDMHILNSIAVLSESQLRLHQTGSKPIQPIPPSKSHL